MPYDENSINGVLNTIARNIGKPPGSFPDDVRVSGAEEVFSVYSVGKGKFDQTMQYINLQVEMFDFSGRRIGLQTGVHVNTTPPKELPAKLFELPPSPPEPVGQPPVGPHLVRTEWTKGLFTFADGSIIAQGPAWTHVVPVTDGSFLFMVTTAQVITDGTGVFAGARGIKQGTGTTYVAPGLFLTKFPSPGFVFEARVTDTFRLIRKGFINSTAISGPKESKVTVAPRGATPPKGKKV